MLESEVMAQARREDLLVGRPPAARGEPADPRTSRWGLVEGEEIAPGLTTVKLLGGGYRYEAYLAWDDRLRSLVVVKVVRPGLVEDRSTLEGLESEVGLLERLNHPVLVRSFGADLAGARPHVVLEHLEGPRLSTLLRKYGPLLPEQLVPLALQLCAAVHYLHLEGVVHLDVKPSNVIMSGTPRLIDLSVALTREQCERLRSPVGTDSWMAPEQCRPGNGVSVGPPADVWGIGATLFRAATGERPFGEGGPDAAVPEERWPQLVEPAKPLSGRIPPSVAAAIAACLAPNPSERPTPGEVADQLEPVLTQLPKPTLISRFKPRLH
jgi:eukaryotic-like serine/threonine-protein kinase